MRQTAPWILENVNKNQLFLIELRMIKDKSSCVCVLTNSRLSSCHCFATLCCIDRATGTWTADIQDGYHLQMPPKNIEAYNFTNSRRKIESKFNYRCHSIRIAVITNGIRMCQKAFHVHIKSSSCLQKTYLSKDKKSENCTFLAKIGRLGQTGIGLTDDRQQHGHHYNQLTDGVATEQHSIVWMARHDRISCRYHCPCHKIRIHLLLKHNTLHVHPSYTPTHAVCLFKYAQSAAQFQKIENTEKRPLRCASSFAQRAPNSCVSIFINNFVTLFELVQYILHFVCCRPGRSNLFLVSAN